jgi:peptide deformylase
MILPIHLYGDPILRKKGIYIKEKSKELDNLIDQMYVTLGEADGVGLAAHQIGKPYKLFIVDFLTSSIESGGLKEVFINPQIIEYSEEQEYFEEGCLSLPGILEEVKRPIKIKVKYLDRDFNEKEEEFTGFLARVIQHEFDHTDGIFFTDRLSPIKKKLITKKLQLILKRKLQIPYKHK